MQLLLNRCTEFLETFQVIKYNLQMCVLPGNSSSNGQIFEYLGGGGDFDTLHWDVWPFIDFSNEQFVSATPKQLHRISETLYWRIRTLGIYAQMCILPEKFWFHYFFTFEFRCLLLKDKSIDMYILAGGFDVITFLKLCPCIKVFFLAHLS